MAKVFLRGRCSRPDDLPDVCMKCGAQADDRVSRTFNWVPQWIGLTLLIAWPVYLILAIVLKKSATVAVPLCEQHKSHWTFRIWLNLGTFVVLVGGGIALAILIGSLSGPGPNDLGGFAVLLVVVALVAWLIILVVSSMTAIRVEEITDDNGVRLTGVCQEFVDAYRDQEDRERAARRGAMERWDDRRDRGRDEDEDERPRRRQRDERVQDRSDEQDERPRRRRESREDEY